MNLRRFAVPALTLCAALLLAGCPNKPSENPSSANPSSAATGKSIKVGLVTDTGGKDDKSFNAAADAGLERAKGELGVDVKVIESKQVADYVPNLKQFAENGYNLVFAVGFLMQDAVKEVAPQYPNVKFAIIDGDAPDLPNCVSLKFREEEGSFLAGALAGLTTKSNKIGFVGGMEMPLIKKFEAGYKAGAQTTNPKVQIVVGYAGKFDDPQKGQELALSQINAGADILYHAAGKSGLGVIKAVEQKGAGFYAIGVDQDQDDLAPGRVLTSMVKRVDVSVFDTIKAAQDGSFQPGAQVFGLKEDGVSLSAMKHTKDAVPAASMTKLDALKQKIISGALNPPATLDELKTFQAPK